MVGHIGRCVQPLAHNATLDQSSDDRERPVKHDRIQIVANTLQRLREP